ncbi:MAG: hypothetical protein U0625_10080 [Phycisphaerales bacterium]
MRRPLFRAAIIAAALAIAGAAAFVAVVARRDARALAEIRARLERGVLEDRARTLRTATGPAVVRGALEELDALDSAIAWKHAWLHTLGADELEEAKSTAADALAAVEAAVAARQAATAWMEAQTGRLEQTAQLAELDAVEAEIARGGPAAAIEPAALADLQAHAQERRERYEAEDARNAAAIAEGAALLAQPQPDPARLRALAAAHLPATDRRAPERTQALASLQAQARARHTAAMLERLAEHERRAQEAMAARTVAVTLRALERDPEPLAGGDPGVAAAREAIRARIAARQRALDAWESGRAAVGAALDAGDVPAAAAALAALQPADEPGERELAALRAGFGARAWRAIEQATRRLSDAGDTAGVRSLLQRIQSDAAAWSALDEEGRARVEALLNPPAPAQGYAPAP